MFDSYVQSFAWNSDEKAPVIPCITIGTFDEIQSIARYGFDMGASATFGKFGHGVYVTTVVTGKETDDDTSKNNNVILVSYTIPGNVYPLIEDDLHKEKPLQGNPVKNGYNSHLVLLDPTAKTVVEGNTSDGENGDTTCVGQFVIEQPSQLVPAFVVHIQPKQS